MYETSPVIAPHFFNDLAKGILQQMFFWGKDVSHLKGNILVSQGFVRTPTLTSVGTSKYRLPWQGGHIELYGSCAGWYGSSGGFTFIRPRKRCALWLSGDETPVPGDWKEEFIGRRAHRKELYLASLPFLDWLISYEQEIVKRYGNNYRNINFKNYAKLPKAKVWLKPSDALTWFQCFRDAPSELTRPSLIHQV